MKKKITGIIIGAIFLAGVAFYGGMRYGKNSAEAQSPGVAGGRGARTAGFRGGVGQGGFVNGEITAKDDKSITVKMRDSSSKFVFFSPTTAVLKSTAGSVDDLVVGTEIVANGIGNTDGSVSAQSIQIRPPGGTPMPR